MKNLFVVTAILLATAALSANATKNIDRTVALSPSGSVVLQTQNGSIDVQTWDRPQLEIHAQIEAAGTWPSDVRRFEDTTVDIEATGDAVRITSRVPTIESWSSWFGNSPKVYYRITAPNTVRWTIYDHNASVDIRDVKAAVTVETHNGPVRAIGLDGPFKADTHNGSITASFAGFHGADVTSHDAPAEMALPTNTAFTLRAASRGGIQSDFPIAIQVAGRRARELAGTIGNGGPTLHFDSHGGRLRLLRKE